MSTSARKRLMRDFKRLQVRGARALPFRAACGGSVCELLTCAVRRAARFVARRKNRRPVLVARPQRATSCIGRPSSSAQRTRRGRVVRARSAAPARGVARGAQGGLCGAPTACASGLMRVSRHRAQAPSSSRSPSRRTTRTRRRPCASSPRCFTPTVCAPPLHLLIPSLTVWCAARVPARSLCRRRHLPGHLAKQLEPHLRRVGGAHLHPVAALRPQPKLASQLRGGADVHRVQARAPPCRASVPSLTLRRPQTRVQQACAGTQLGWCPAAHRG